MDEEWVENRREYVRFALNVPLFGELSLLRVGEREIRSRNQRVLLSNISVGGCRFTTSLRIPVRDDVEWQIKLQLGRYSVKLRAVILHESEEDGLSSYGVRWVMTGIEKQAFQYRLSEYLRLVLVSSPHILSLYKKIADRHNDDFFKKLDVTS